VRWQNSQRGQALGEKGFGNACDDVRPHLRRASCIGGSDSQMVKAFLEAEAYDGPSIIIAYSHCINQGYDMSHGLEQQKAAVETGYWPLLRYDPRLAKQGKNPLQLDSKAPSQPLEKFAYNETRFTMLVHSNEEAAERLMKLAQQDVNSRWKMYQEMANMDWADPATKS